MSRATLKPIISKLREIIIKNIAGKLEKYGFDDSGCIIANKPLSEYENVIKSNLISLFKGRNIEGNKKEYIAYIQDSARTFLHILICFKTMEQRGIMGNVVGRLMNDYIYDNIIPDFNNIHPLAFSDLSTKFYEEILIMEEKDNSEEDREYYNFIFMLSALTKEMAKEVPLLFKDYEHNLVHPDFDGLKEILFNINKLEECEFNEDDFLGWIYQYWVDIKDDELKTAKSEKDISYANSIFYKILNNLDEEQTQFGEFYTPRWVVKYIVDNTLKLYYAENQKVETIKLLDPACGAGNFLVYAFDVFYELYKIEHPKWTDNMIITYILEKNIFGVDIQREPLQITAINLWLKAKKKAQDVKIKNLNLFNMNILKANSLYRWENDKEDELQISLFHTDIELTEKKYTAEDIGQYISTQEFTAKKEARLFFKNKFNIIVMNPPFVDARRMDTETLEFLKSEYPENARNLFSAFIHRAIELSIKKGIIGFISSDTFLTINSFTDIRKEMINKTILHAALLGNNVFDGPTVTASIMLIKNESNKENTIRILKIKGSEFEIEKEMYLKQKKLLEIKDYPFVFNMTDRFRDVFKEKSIGDFDNLFEVRKGIVTANDNKYLKYKWEVNSNEIGANFLKYNKEHSIFLTDVNYVLDWRNEIKKEIQQNPSSRCAYILDNYSKGKKQYNFKKGVVFKLVGEFCCALLENDRVFNVTTPAILMDNMKYQFYLLAYLNSKFVRFILSALNSTISNTPGDVRRLPFKIPDEDLLQLVDIKTKEIINIKEFMLGFNYISDYYHMDEISYGFLHGANTINEAYQIFINKYNSLEVQLYNFNKQIDEMIYQIYKLGPEEISLVENEYPNVLPKPNKNSDIKKVSLNFIRAITKDTIFKESPKLYQDSEIEIIIKQHIENKFENGYKICEEIESIFEKPIIEVIRSGIKIGSKTITLAGAGSKDLDEPLLQQKVLSGTGVNKQIVLWHLSHFLLEFDEDKKYVMQNEIRRLSNDMYRPRLQNIKEKLQEPVSGTEKKELEKQEKLLSEAFKTLEAWKVIN